MWFARRGIGPAGPDPHAALHLAATCALVTWPVAWSRGTSSTSFSYAHTAARVRSPNWPSIGPGIEAQLLQPLLHRAHVVAGEATATASVDSDVLTTGALVDGGTDGDRRGRRRPPVAPVRRRLGRPRRRRRGRRRRRRAPRCRAVRPRRPLASSASSFVRREDRGALLTGSSPTGPRLPVGPVRRGSGAQRPALGRGRAVGSVVELARRRCSISRRIVAITGSELSVDAPLVRGK